MMRELDLSYASGSQEIIVSYLPLSHIAAQMMDIWMPIKIGALTFFAQPDALRVRLGEGPTKRRVAFGERTGQARSLRIVFSNFILCSIPQH